MTQAIRQQAVQTEESDPIYDNYNYGDDQGYEEGIDEDVDFNGGDEFTLESDDSGTGGSFVPQTANEMRGWLRELRADGSLTEAEYNRFLGEVNHAVSLTGPRFQQKLAEIAGEVSSKLTGGENAGVDENGMPIAGDGEDNGAALATELKDYKTVIDGIQNLSAAKKAEYKGKIDQWISSIELGSADPEAIYGEFEELKAEIEEVSVYSLGAQSLSQLTGADAEEIDSKAKAHGLDLNKLPNPPTQEVIEFLMEISPALAEKFEAVKTAITARNEEITTYADAANAQNSANAGCSSDNDATDMKNFQRLYDLKYHQDPKSKAVASAMKDANEELIGLLQGLYPDLAGNIKMPDASAQTDWKAADEDYRNADKLIFAGMTFDLFNNSDGGLNFGSPDTETVIEIPSIQYDWEGSGDWEDKSGKPSCTTYGEDIKISCYD